MSAPVIAGGWLMNGGSVAATQSLFQVYPKGVVPKELRNFFHNEIVKVIHEVEELLPCYRRCVDGRTYDLALAKLRLAVAWARDDTAGVRTLEASLKHLLRQKQVFAAASAERPDVTEQLTVQLQNRLTGAVKMYKTMMWFNAAHRNTTLREHDSLCSWTPATSEVPPGSQPQLAGALSRPLADPAEKETGRSHGATTSCLAARATDYRVRLTERAGKALFSLGYRLRGEL